MLNISTLLNITSLNVDLRNLPASLNVDFSQRFADNFLLVAIRHQISWIRLKVKNYSSYSNGLRRFRLFICVLNKNFSATS